MTVNIRTKPYRSQHQIRWKTKKTVSLEFATISLVTGISVRHDWRMFHVGDVVRKLRNDRGWSQTQLADAAGVNKETVVRIESGLVTRTDKLAAIAGALKRTVPDLYRSLLPGGADGATDPDLVDVAGYTPDDIPVLGEGQASPQGSIHFDEGGASAHQADDWVARPPDVKDPTAYGVRVRDDSMVPAYRPGMIAIVSPNTPLADGDEACVHLRSGERLIKIVRRIHEGYILESANPAYPARHVTDTEVMAIHTIVYAKRKITGGRPRPPRKA